MNKATANHTAFLNADDIRTDVFLQRNYDIFRVSITNLFINEPWRSQ